MTKSKEWEQIKNLYSYLKQHEPPKKLWCGIEGVEFIYHNTWADPEIKYKGHLFDCIDVEDYFWEDFIEEMKEQGIEETMKNETTFENHFPDWLKNHSNDVKYYLDNLLME